ncbi:DoxX family protein [Streptomyces boncukensis]|uniref:DoxX family protein n=1 Tax=Streptomyces boncukensis TaxID=2711219 RepID=A0A6G4X9U0_9ACTN|nr:DoxX family protein [Streptomyces boncukensis]NGO73630.1 DoxX family protein [Streptomyces boncukensis]
MSSPHAPAAPRLPYDAGLLVMRLAIGLTIAAHGSQKLFGWFDGGGLDGTAQFFESIGYPSGKAMAVVAGLSETFGGLGLALGLLTPLAGAAVVGTMINVLVQDWDHGFFGGIELPVLIGAGAAAIALAGPGQWAADRAIPVVREHRFAYGAGALVFGAVVAGIVLLFKS